MEPLKHSLRRQGNPILELSGDNQRLLLATREAVQVRSLDSSRVMTLTNARVYPETRAQFSFDGKRVLITSTNEVAAWSSEDGTFEGYLLKFDKSASVLDLSRDGTLALVRSEELLRVWSVYSGVPYSPSFRPVDGLTRARFSPNGWRIATMSGTVAQIWDSTAAVALTEPFQHEGKVDIEFSSDGGRALAILATAWVGQSALVHSANSEESLFATNRESNLIYAGPRIARLWEVACREAIHTPSALTQPKGAFLEIGPDGATGFRASTNGHGYLLNVVSNGLPHASLNLQRTVRQARFSPNGSRLLTLDEAGIVRVWAVETRQQLFVLEDTPPIHAAEFSAGNHWIFTIGSNHLVRVWDSASGKALAALHHDSLPQFARASLDGERIVTGSGWPGHVVSVRTWQARSGRLLQELKREVPFLSVELSPDGRFFITTTKSFQGVGLDNSARLWDAETGGLQRAFLHSSWISAATFSSDGRRVVTACEDGGARVWSVESGTLLTEVKQRANTISAALSPDGLRLVTSCADGTTRVWDSRTGLPMTEPFRHHNSFHKSRFSASGERVIIEPRSTLVLVSARWKPAPMALSLQRPHGIDRGLF